jgi:hypothetical protein
MAEFLKPQCVAITGATGYILAAVRIDSCGHTGPGIDYQHLPVTQIDDCDAIAHSRWRYLRLGCIDPSLNFEDANGTPVVEKEISAWRNPGSLRLERRRHTHRCKDEDCCE